MSFLSSIKGSSEFRLVAQELPKIESFVLAHRGNEAASSRSEELGDELIPASCVGLNAIACVVEEAGLSEDQSYSSRRISEDHDCTHSSGGVLEELSTVQSSTCASGLPSGHEHVSGVSEQPIVSAHVKGSSLNTDARHQRRVSWSMEGSIPNGAVARRIRGVPVPEIPEEDVMFESDSGNSTVVIQCMPASEGVTAGMVSLEPLKRRMRGHRGFGARARSRSRERLRRSTRQCVCAIGSTADACTTIVEEQPSVFCMSSRLARDRHSGTDDALAGEAERHLWKVRLARLLGRRWGRRKEQRSLDLEIGKVAGEGTIMLTTIETGWRGHHSKRHGDLSSHVRYLQWVFRSSERLAKGAWAARAVPRWVWVALKFCRRPRFTKCQWGHNLADDAEFVAQQELANEMLDWYGQYPAILRKLTSNDSVRVLDDFCGGGAVGEGIRRGGGVPFGVDIEDQPAYKTRFAEESFTQADGVDWSVIRGLQRRHGLRLAGASPPCKFYSTARQKGESKQPPLIERTRDMLAALFHWWWIENVMGAQHYMSDNAVEVDGPYFGLRVFRSRLFETNFGLHIDEAVRRPADRLRARCCLGCRNRWRTFDEFGRPYLTPCCQGNVFIPIGDSPWRCTSGDCADAMGVDRGHMPYDRLAQAVPPAYSQWVFGQMCMRVVEAEYGCPAFTFDAMRANPAVAKRALARWLVGIGADSPSAGMSLVPRIETSEVSKGATNGAGVSLTDGNSSEDHMNSERMERICYSGRQASVEPLLSVSFDGTGKAAPFLCTASIRDSVEGENSLSRVAGALPLQGSKEDVVGHEPPEVPVRFTKVAFRPAQDDDGVSLEPKPCSGGDAAVDAIVTGLERDALVDESSFRELYYAHFGGYDAQWSGVGSLPWLETLRTCKTWGKEGPPTVDDLVGRNTYLEVPPLDLPIVCQAVEMALDTGGRGTRMTIVTTIVAAKQLVKSCYERVNCETTYGGSDALAPKGLTAVWCGRRASPRFNSCLVHSEVNPVMDPRDQDGYTEDKEAKEVLSWTPLSHDATLWRGKGMPADVEQIMCEGVRIEADVDTSGFEVPQYPYPDDASMLESLLEADRALAVGHMEYVPDSMVETVLENHIVHPWLMVWQGKWRLCQDYSDGTNKLARSGPFGLPSAWDARKVLKPGSYMAKYDLRDFFWSIPVHEESRCRLVMRHPGTGRLMWCRTLPFGYLDSPRQACRVSEALAGEMRRRAAGKGIHFLCYVDDYLVIGDTLELTKMGQRIF